MSQISYIKYKDIIEAWRIDADFFKPEYLKIDETIEKQNYNELKGLIWKWNIFSWPFGSSLKSESYTNYWTPFIRISDIQDLFINKENLMYISEEDSERLNSTTLNIWDIVLSKIWTIWRLSLITSDLWKVNISENNIWLRLQNLSDKEKKVLLLFLLSKYWQEQIIRQWSWNVQLKINVSNIEELKIPNLQLFNIDKISKIYDDILYKHEQSKYLYQEAEDLLLTELWLKNHTISHTLTFSTTKKAVDEAWRYDADYFQPKYDGLIEKIENYKWGWDYVENCIKVQDKNFIPEEWKLYKYIALANVSAQWFISDCEENYWENLPTRARRILHKWDVIVSSIEWSLSSCAVIEDEFDWWLCSNWFYVLNSSFFNSECLLVLFKSNIIQSLLKKWCSWTILTAISKDELNKIKLPLINSQLQKEISDKIKESFKLRNESKELLEQAKKMVEDEIEKE